MAVNWTKMPRPQVTWAARDAELSDAEDSAVARLLSVGFHLAADATING